MKLNNILVSVIIPIYNVEDYLEKCLLSVVNQTYKKLEIILVDDGSQDKCYEICEKWKRKDSRITVIHKENKGLSDARNVGIERAKGDYLSFVDSDDYISSDFIETMLNNAIKNNADISCVNYQEYFINDKVNQNTFFSDDRHIIIMDKFAAIKQILRVDGFGNYAWNKLYKKYLFDDVQYPVGKKMEDLGTTYKLIEKCNDRIVYDSRKLYFYLQRDNSILHSPNQQFFLDKYEQTVERYIYLNNIYGSFWENENYLVTSIFDCMPYLTKTLNLESRKLFKSLLKSKNIKWKRKIKMAIVDKFNGTYCKLYRR